MTLEEFFQPGVDAYWRYCLGFCARYFLVAGGLVVVLHGWGRRHFRARRIQRSFPRADEIRHEIVWSMSNALCSGVTTMLIYAMARRGWTAIYLDVSSRGWLYLAGSVVLGVLAYDTWFYWQHRLLHTPWLFRYVHAVHHRVRNPTALANFAHHPVETACSGTFFLLLVCVVPLHPTALLAIGGYLFATGLMIHLGYEWFPSGAPRHGILGWWVSATHHNLHHARVRGNFGACFTLWDRWLGTTDPTYEAAFDAVTRRAAAGGASPRSEASLAR